jgi:hypothetical protein
MDKYPMGGGTLVCEENDGEGNWMTCRAYNDTTGTGTHLVNVTQRVSGPGVLNLWDTITTASVSLDGREMASTSISQRAWDQYHHPEQAWSGNAPLLLLFSAVATAALVIGLIAYILASRQPPAGK